MGLTQSEFFDAIETFTGNSRESDEIMAGLDTQGVTTDDLDAGDALLATAKLKAGLQGKAALALQLHMPIYDAAEKLAHAEYQDLVGGCRAELSEAQIKGLQIKEMPEDTAKFVKAAIALLDAIPEDDDIKTALANRKRGAARLAVIRAAVNDFDKQFKKLKRLKGALKQTTTDRNDAIKPLRTWFIKFSRFARLGLKTKKDLLGQILKPTPKRKAGKSKTTGTATNTASPSAQ